MYVAHGIETHASTAFFLLRHKTKVRLRRKEAFAVELRFAIPR